MKKDRWPTHLNGRPVEKGGSVIGRGMRCSSTPGLSWVKSIRPRICTPESGWESAGVPAFPTLPGSDSDPPSQRGRKPASASATPLICVSIWRSRASLNPPPALPTYSTHHLTSLHPPLLLSCHPYPPKRRVEISLRSSPSTHPCRRSTLPAFYPSPFPRLSASAADCFALLSHPRQE